MARDEHPGALTVAVHAHRWIRALLAEEAATREAALAFGAAHADGIRREEIRRALAIMKGGGKRSAREEAAERIVAAVRSCPILGVEAVGALSPDDPDATLAAQSDREAS